jgi:hypothetical protein
MVLKRLTLALVLLALGRLASAQPVAPAVSRALTSTTCGTTGPGCLTLTVAGYGTVGIGVSGTWSGTLQFVGAVDRTGSNFSPLNCTPPNSTNPVTTTTANGSWTCDVSGLGQVQVGFNSPNGSYSSGTATVTLQASSASSARGQAPAGSGGTSSAFGSALPANGTAAGFKKSSDSSMQAGTLDDNAYLQVNCKTGCSGASDTTGSSVALGSLNAADTVALAGEGGASFHLAAGTLDGTLTPELSFDGGATYPVATKFVGNGFTSSATIVVTNPSAAQDISVLVLGGATHARVRVSTYNSGTATGHLTSTASTMPAIKIIDTMTVSGTVTVTQGTGTNLHAVIDSGSTTAVTQATAGNLNATVVGTGTFATQSAQSGTWTVQPGNTANTTAWKVDGSAVTQPVSGTFFQATQPVSTADGAQVTLGAKGDAKSTATDTTAITAMSVLKEISAMEQAPASRAVTNAGTFAVQAAESGTWTVQPGNTANTTSWLVDAHLWNGAALASPDANSYPIVAPAATATANAAASDCNVLSAASTNSTSCKGSAGNLYGYELYNTTTTVYYLRLYNSSSAPTCSSATGFIRSIPIPPAATAGLVGGAVNPTSLAVNYGTGIGYCLTGGSSSTDNTNAAVGIFGVLKYK